MLFIKPAQVAQMIPIWSNWHTVSQMEKDTINELDLNNRAVESLVIEIKYVLLLINSCENLIKYLKTEKLNTVYYSELLCPPNLLNILEQSVKNLKDQIVKLRAKEELNQAIMEYITTFMKDNNSFNNRIKRKKGLEQIGFLEQTIIDSFTLKSKVSAKDKVSLPEKHVKQKRQTVKNPDEKTDLEVINKLIQQIAFQKTINDIQKNLSTLVFFRYKNGIKKNRETVKISELLEEVSKSTETRFQKLSNILKNEQQNIKKLLIQGDFNEFVLTQDFQLWFTEWLITNDIQTFSLSGKESFISLLFILHKLYNEMNEDVKNLGKTGYNKTPFSRNSAEVVKALENALLFLNPIINDCFLLTTFLQFDDMADNLTVKKVQGILLEAKEDL